MRTRTVAILLVVVVVLVPTWFAAAQPVEQAEEVGIDTGTTDMRPLQSIIDTPQVFTPAQVGVVIWLALGALLAVLMAFHRFMANMVRPSGGPSTISDGGTYPWFQTENRWLGEYIEASESQLGLLVVLTLSVLTVVLSVLVVTEFFSLARTQYVGLYVGGIFLSLAGLTAAYYAWFMPHVHVAEVRYYD